MTLPSSGPLTLAQIQGEFGGSNPISLSEYYAGGGLVPAGTTGTFGAVPSSGTISIRNFYGTSNNLFRSGTITAGSSSFQAISIFGKNLGNGEGSCTPPDTFILNGGVVSFGINTTIIGGFFNQNFFQVSGTQPNSGWEKLVINSPVSGTITYFRVNAISFQTGGGISTWTWPTGGIIFSARNQQGSIVID